MIFNFFDHGAFNEHLTEVREVFIHHFAIGIFSAFSNGSINLRFAVFVHNAQIVGSVFSQDDGSVVCFFVGIPAARQLGIAKVQLEFFFVERLLRHIVAGFVFFQLIKYFFITAVKFRIFVQAVFCSEQGDKAVVVQ